MTKYKVEKRGRKTIMTQDRIDKLVEAFKYGASDLEACAYADIAPATLYKYQERHPEFTEYKAKLKELPTFTARKSVVDRLPRDPDLALKYLERRKSDEFSTKQNVDHTTNGKDLPTPILGGITKDGDALRTDNSNQEDSAPK